MKNKATEHLKFLEGLNSDVLLHLIDLATEVLSKREGEDLGSRPYGRLSLALKNSEDFSYEQLESFRPWFALPKTKRQQFNKAWMKSIKNLTSLGFKDNKALHTFILDMVVKSPLLEESLSFAAILESLESSHEMLFYNFPSFSSCPEGLQLLVKRLGSMDV